MRIASWVSASTPSVTRTRTRWTPAAAANAASSGASRTTAAPSAAASRRNASPLLFPCTTISSPREPGRPGERELTGRRDVGADSLLAEEAEHGDVGERLRPERDVAVRADSRAKRPRSRAQRLLAVDDERACRTARRARLPPTSRRGRGQPRRSGPSPGRGRAGFARPAAHQASTPPRLPRRRARASPRARAARSRRRGRPGRSRVIRCCDHAPASRRGRASGSSADRTPRAARRTPCGSRR